MNLSEKLRIVNEYRKHIPVDVTGLARSLGIVVREAFLPADISGIIAPVDGSFAITVNAAHATTRKRFTIAHELGHYLLHQHLIGSGVDDDIAYRSTSSGRYRNTAIGPKEETEANKLAAGILMPYEQIELQQEMGIERTDELAKRFGVSEHAMSIRLGRPY